MVLKNKRVLLVFVFCFLFFAPFLFVKASPLELNYPEFFGQKITSETTLPEYIKYIFNFALFAVGLIFLGSLVWTGITYLTSAGRPAKMAEAKERLGSAFLGVVIIFASYIILTSINPELAILKLPDLKPIEQPSKYVSNPQECKPEELNTIAHEIPIGDLIKNIFEQKIDDTPAVDLLQATVKSFDKFLKKEIEIGLDKETGSDKVNRISDLNKYLKSLSEDCHCAETKAVCQKPKNFSFPVGCLGDPCPKKIRKKIKKALDIDTGKVSALLNYRKKFNDLKNAFEQEGRRFRQLMDALEGCKRRELLNRREFYNNLAFIEKQNGEIKIIHSHIQAQADPLTFYCVAGGSIFDYPYLPSQEISLPEPEESPRPGLPEATTPASCPVYIPMGEALIEPITEISYKINRNIEDIIFYIDEMTADISKMEELISHCNRQHCKVNCSCVPNPCFECCAGPHCIFCIPFCKSPCLQTVGTCFGDPCGGARKEIGQIPERLKIY
ncbi:MAG TPA: hypothetical protein ENL33_00805, partial [Candidatus Parcubacteria bacterium]|nr:hypothetical protein [Candidatus Parcubacteria bacterium]